MDDLVAVPEDWERALAIVAHPDDMEYGLSAAVARWTAQGKRVDYLLVTRGEAGIDTLDPAECARVRGAEQRAACDVVGATDLDFLDLPDGVIEYGLPLRKALARAIRRARPDVVLTLSGERRFAGGQVNMADHVAVGEAVIDAVRDADNRWVFPDLTDADTPAKHHTRFILLGASDHPTHAVDVADTLADGIASLRAHEAYLAALPDHPDPADLIGGIANATAARFGGRPAVPVELIG